MNSKFKTIVIVAITLIAGYLFFINKPQSASDCSKSENYNASTKKCVLKNGAEYAKEIEEIEEKERVAKTEISRRNGTTCIPASEAYNYIGVTGCVRLGVYTTNHTNYGYSWLDSESSDSPTEFVVFAKNNILTVNDNNYYFKRIIEVSGTIEEYNGKAQIEITDKSAIKDIGTIEERQQHAINTLQDIQKNYRCENYHKYKNDPTNPVYKMYSNLGSECANYTPTTTETSSDRRKKCFEEKIKNTRTKSAKDSVYDSCRNA